MIRDTFPISEISEPFTLALFAKCTTSTFKTDVRCSSESLSTQFSADYDSTSRPPNVLKHSD